jgi:HK97 family phage prohead protease/HK97 family phage major capsid protein
VSNTKILRLDSLLEFKGYKSEGDDDFYIEGYASTPAVDRDHEILPVDAIDLKNFQNNPIILYQHNRDEPVGKAVEIEKRAEGLWMKVLISKAATKVKTLIEEGILKAFSVGFRIKDWDYNEALDAFVYKDVELFETSIVSIPCNQEALFSQVKSFNDELKDELKKKDTKNPEPTKKETKEMDELKKLQEEMERIKAEKEALETEKKLKEQAEKEAKLEAERTELKEGIKTLTDSLTSISEAIKEVEGKIEAVKSEYDEKLEEIEKRAPKVESVPLSAKEIDECMDSYKEVLIHTMLFPKDKIEESKAFQALDERMKAVSLDSQFTTRVHRDLLRDIKNEASIYPLFREIPSSVTTDTIPFGPELTTTWGSSATDQTFTPLKVSIDYHSIFGRLDYNYVVDEESIIAWLPFIRTNIVEAVSSGIDAQILDAASAPTATFRGLASYAMGAGYTVEVADEADLVVGDIDAVRAKLSKYGVNPRNLVIVVNSDKYLQLVDDDLVTPIDKFGAGATIKTGELSRVRGISVIVNDNAPGSSVAGNTNIAFTMFNTNAFAVKMKSFMVEFDKTITSQTGILVASARAGFGPLYPQTAGEITNSIVAVGVNPV